MRTSHLLSDELFELAMDEIQAGNKFIAYNSVQYLLDKGDMEFFSNSRDANDFAFNNSSDLDHFNTLKVNSVMDIYDHFEIVQALTEHSTILSQIKHTTMEENNYDYLAKQLKWAGFGETLNANLRTNMQEGKAEFQLTHQYKIGDDKIDGRLDFKKSADKEMYFFNSYTLKVTIPGQDTAVEQKFYINNKQDNISLKEGYNLIHGRAVEKEITPKEGEKFKAWVQLDFKETDNAGNFKMKQFHPNYGFDLEKVLEKHPFKELLNPGDKTQLMESLQRGNRQMVTLEKEGKDVKIFIEAAPQFKSLNYYNAEMKRVNSHELVEGEKQGQEKKNGMKQKTGGDDDVDKRKRGQKAKQGM